MTPGIKASVLFIKIIKTELLFIHSGLFTVDYNFNKLVSKIKSYQRQQSIQNSK